MFSLTKDCLAYIEELLVYSLVTHAFVWASFEGLLVKEYLAFDTWKIFHYRQNLHIVIEIPLIPENISAFSLCFEPTQKQKQKKKKTDLGLNPFIS